MRPASTLDVSRIRVLDGGFATELERRGVSIAGPLWSARALSEAPEAVLAVHGSYLEAGADVLSTGSYQVSSRGYAAVGLGPEAAREAAAEALRASVRLAREAAAHTPAWVAASLGPYGAALANGAEFHGRYGFASAAEQHRALVEFHAERIEVLAEIDADLLAFETVPSLAEARAIAEAIQAVPTVGAWLSITCRDGVHTAHGEPVRECAAFLDAVPQVLAVGVNCIAPGLVSRLLGELRAGTSKPLLAYPNSGEGWDAGQRRWTGVADVETYGAMAREWFAAGAQAVGGCCRTGPAHVRAVVRAFRGA